MKGQPYERAVDLAKYIIENESTVRKTASYFGLSKSTVHKDIKERLLKVSPALYEECEKVIQKNKEERHMRGGMATKKKYEKLRKNKNAQG